MVNGFTVNLAKKLLLKTLERSSGGSVEIVCPQETFRFGQQDDLQSKDAQSKDSLHAVVAVHDERFFRRAIFGGDVGVGEAYMDGDWSTPDLVSLVRFGIRNLDRLDAGSRLFGLLTRTVDFVSHLRRGNTEVGSKKNIAYHYDLGNDFYRLFLDQSLAYSCAYYESPEDSLEMAQRRKFEVICRKLQLGPQDEVLEIGTGWGGFAAYAAQQYGCRITTTTISRQQHDYAI